MGERRSALLTVSGTIPADLDEQVRSGRRPRADYRVIADRLHADVVDVASATRELGVVGRWLGRFGGPGALLAWYAFRHRRDYAAILSDGEQVGLPLALLTRLFGGRGSRHVMIVHVLSVPKKERLMRWFRLGPLVDRYVVYCSRQAEFIGEHLGVEPDRIVQMPFMVDAEFFSPSAVSVDRRRRICAVGLERRDYATLLDAVDGLDVDVVIAAASPWSKQADSSRRRSIPANVTVDRFDLAALRELYASSQFVVVPLFEVDFQAGITTILEAMAMERAVVCTRTPGQVDTVQESVTGRYVAPGDAGGLRRTITELIDDPGTTSRLGEAGRAWVVGRADVDTYADALAQVVRSAVSAS